MRAVLAREAEVLPAVSDAAALTAAAAGRLVVREAERVSAEQGARLTAGAGGSPKPPWFQNLELPVGETALHRVEDAWLLPGFGAVIGQDGTIYASSVGGAKTRWPDHSGLPGMTPDGAGFRFDPPPDAPRVGPAAVFQPWGGGFNYGHFLLDGLSSLLAMEEAGLLASHQPLAPPLKPWQAGLLDLAFPDVAIATTPAEIVRAEAAVFPSTLDHFLGTPNELLVRLQERILARAPAGKGARRVYLSRRGQAMRVMVDEPALEAALRRRGFQIVRPERLSPAAQVSLMRDAEVVVAPTGAALANALFLPDGARMVEIAPENYASHWVLAICRLIGADWRPFYCASPCPASEVPLLKRIRSYVFAYRLPVEAFLAHLDPLL